MALFTAEHFNKIDRKGRVSVPAEFRKELNDKPFKGVVLFPAEGLQALDGYGSDRVEQLAEALDSPELYSEDELKMAEILFAEAHRLPFDNEGRIILPEALMHHAAIDEQAIFAGHGRYFRIWNPDAYRNYKAALRSKLAAKGQASLRLKPAPKSGDQT